MVVYYESHEKGLLFPCSKTPEVFPKFLGEPEYKFTKLVINIYFNKVL